MCRKVCQPCPLTNLGRPLPRAYSGCQASRSGAKEVLRPCKDWRRPNRLLSPNSDQRFQCEQNLCERRIERQDEISRILRFHVPDYPIHNRPSYKHGLSWSQLKSSHLSANNSLHLKPVLRATITAVRQGSANPQRSAPESRLWFRIRGSVCLLSDTLHPNQGDGVDCKDRARPQRMAQLKITAMTLRIFPLVFGARSSAFNHCSIVTERLCRKTSAKASPTTSSGCGFRYRTGTPNSWSDVWHFFRDVPIQEGPEPMAETLGFQNWPSISADARML